MALGLLLRVSWICFLLFDCSASSPAVKGYGYPYTADSRNIGDDGEDELLTSPTFDQSNWQASNNQPIGPVYTSFSNPTAVQQPNWVPSKQDLPNAPSGPAVERLINGASRDWGLENHDKPLLFPLASAPAKPQPAPAQPQSTSVGAASAYSEPASTYSEPASSSTGSSAQFASPTAYHTPSATSQAAKSPSFQSWQPEPISSGYGVVDFNTDSSAAGSNIPHLVYEDVFQYPVEEPSFPSSPTNAGSQPVYSSGLGRFPGGINLGDTVYQPRDELSWGPHKPANTQRVETSQRVSEPIFPPAPPPVYSIRSKSGYQHGRYLFAQSRYTPEFPSPMPVSVESVEQPVPSQPAAPKGANNPQRIKW